MQLLSLDQSEMILSKVECTDTIFLTVCFRLMNMSLQSVWQRQTFLIRREELVAKI